MAVPILMPKQGITVESCIITKWHKKIGEEVKKGELLFSYETDKASFDQEAEDEGTLLEVFYNDGDEVPVLVNIGVLGKPGENTSEFKTAGAADTAEAKPTEAVAETKTEAVETTVVSAPLIADGEKIKISPRAKNLAEKSGADIRLCTPTGPYGRIVEKDVRELLAKGGAATMAAKDAAASMAAGSITGTGIGGKVSISDLNAPAKVQEAVNTTEAQSAEVTVVKMPNIRKVIARAMQNSLNSMAQLTLNASFDATDIMNFRKKCKESGAALGLEKVTINDIILYAVAKTLPAHKDLNANLIDDSMHYYKNVNLGMAVDTDRGLMVPVIFNANNITLKELSSKAKELASSAQNGSINPDYMRNGSFTVTNLGSLGVESFTPVINPPQTGILGVNTIVDRVKTVNGELKTYPSMTLSLTFDHRAVDGAPAARFLKDLKTNLENFTLLLAK